MRQSFLLVSLGVAALVSGCATKGYVKKSVDPVQSKVDQVATETNKNTTDIQQTNQNVDKNRTAISATDEKATGADRRAGEAMNSATQANQKADKDTQEISQLRGVIANIDDYKVSGQATVLFGFNRANLTNDDKQQLDMLASSIGNQKRYFVAVEGFTDKTGPASYNLDLSRRRAEAVVQYLVAEKMVPFYQIRTIGLGDQQPADSGNTRDARAKNRRVEVKIFSAPALGEGGGAAAGGGSR